MSRVATGTPCAARVEQSARRPAAQTLGGPRQRSSAGCNHNAVDRNRRPADPLDYGTHRLRAYPVWARACRAVFAFLKAIRPQASWRSARWFSSFFDQRIRMPRLRLSQEWQASTTQRRAFQPGVRAFNLISSPRARMCGV